jgi:hypothetical protein
MYGERKSTLLILPLIAPTLKGVKGIINIFLSFVFILSVDLI